MSSRRFILKSSSEWRIADEEILDLCRAPDCGFTFARYVHSSSRGLDAIRGALHHLGRALHQLADQRWQRTTSGFGGLMPVTGFIRLHGADDAAALFVLLRQFFQMLAQMLGHLLLGFRDKAKTPLVAGQPRSSANRK